MNCFLSSAVRLLFRAWFNSRAVSITDHLAGTRFDVRVSPISYLATCILQPSSSNLHPFLARFCVFLLTISTGCASITNPVANGIPAHLVPDELLVESKHEFERIPLTWLRRKPETVYKLAPGDILGVYIEGVLGETDQVPPIYEPPVADLPPSVGFPIPIRENGTVPLPLIKPVDVDGMSIGEAQQAIEEAYTEKKQILKGDEARILVTLASPRQSEILVLREDSPQQRRDVPQMLGIMNQAAPIISERGSGSGKVVRIPSGKADVLEVLARTGGLPGVDAADEVIVQRGYGNMSQWPIEAKTTDRAGSLKQDTAAQDDDERPRFVRIPLRLRRGDRPPFDIDDITLQTGDVVFVPALDHQVYYTGGLLPPRDVPLPRDYDLGVREALIRVGGSMVSGGMGMNNISGGLVGSGIGNPSPSLVSILRRTPDGGQVTIRVNLNTAIRDPRENLLVQAGDVLILQETPAESVARYVSQVFNLSIVGKIFNRGDATASAAFALP